MKSKIYSIRDTKTAAFSPPMYQATDGAMMRQFSDAVNNNDKDNNLYHHSEDFEMFALGAFDHDTGLFETHAPKTLATAAQLKLAK